MWKALIAARLKPSGFYRTQNLRPIDFSALISQLGSWWKTTRAAARKTPVVARSFGASIAECVRDYACVHSLHPRCILSA